jgi:hypothetical protein
LITVYFNAINCPSDVFVDCLSSITTLYIGSNVQKISDNAFASPNMTEIYIDAVTPPQIYTNTFYNVPNTIPVYVPCGSAENYRNASFWNNFRNIQEKGSFIVTLQSNNSLMGTARLVQPPCQSNVAIIDAVANTGYRFVQWNDGNSQNPRSITVTQDTSFTATFAIASQGIYHVSVSANNPSMGSVSGSGDYASNTTAIITATPNIGYHFVQWNDSNSQNPRTITVSSDTSFIAMFSSNSQVTCHVSVTANNPSMGSVSGSGDYAANTTVIIAAIANANYRFVQWTDGNKQNPRTITVTQDTSFTATFAVLAQGTYHLSVSANNPIMGNVSSGGDYAANTTTIIAAVANANYHFVQWHDGNTQNPRSITVTQDTSFIAVFDVTMYYIWLNTNASDRGTVSGSGDYVANSVASITASPNANYRFVSWHDGNKNNPRSFTVTQDSIFMALFGKEGMYYVYASPNSTSMGSVSGSGDYQKSISSSSIFHAEYSANSIATLKAIPNSGYRFVSWDDGNTDNPRELTVTEDIIFKAIFDITNGIEDTKASTIAIYPNPARDNITVIFPENIYQGVFSVYDMQGKVLIRKEINSQDVVSVSILAAGIYIYNLTTDKQNYTGKLVINN